MLVVPGVLLTVNVCLNMVTALPGAEFYLQWSRHVLNAHGRYLREAAGDAKQTAMLRALYKSLLKQQDGIGKLCDENRYSLQFLVTSIELSMAAAEDEAAAESGSESDLNFDEPGSEAAGESDEGGE